MKCVTSDLSDYCRSKGKWIEVELSEDKYGVDGGGANDGVRQVGTYYNVVVSYTRL